MLLPFFVSYLRSSFLISAVIFLYKISKMHCLILYIILEEYIYFSRRLKRKSSCCCSSVVEHSLGKGEAASSILASSTNLDFQFKKTFFSSITVSQNIYKFSMLKFILLLFYTNLRNDKYRFWRYLWWL